MKFWVLVLFCSSCFGVSVTNSTSTGFQLSCTNGTVGPGDTITLRGGTYFPPGTNANCYGGDPCWTIDLKGTPSSYITIRSYPGETAVIDRPGRFGSSCWLRFRDLEIINTDFGHGTVNPAYPNGLWVHYDGTVLNSSNEWINCYFHSIDIALSGSVAGSSVRGCNFIYCGVNPSEHVVYPSSDVFSGNIVGWSSGDSVNLQQRALLAQNNIFFGVGQTTGGTNSGGDMLLSTYDCEVSYNYAYNRYANNFAPTSISSDTQTAVIKSNILVGSVGLKTSGSMNLQLVGNTLHMLNLFEADAIFHRLSTNGTWSFDYNNYSANAFGVHLDDEATAGGIGYSTFAQWRSAYPAFDVHSTSVNSAIVPDTVKVLPNQDDPKRCHIVIFNGSSNDNVTVSMTGVLNAGDNYRLYSAQNYGAGPIKTGSYNGSSISVPMTNLTVAPLLYAPTTNGYGTVLRQPPLTSPEFAAFVLVGSAGPNIIINSKVTTYGKAVFQ